MVRVPRGIVDRSGSELAGNLTVDDPDGYPSSALLDISAFLAILSLPLLAIGIWLARSG